jgi:hypothetical protein
VLFDLGIDRREQPSAKEATEDRGDEAHSLTDIFVGLLRRKDDCLAQAVLLRIREVAREVGGSQPAPAVEVADVPSIAHAEFGPRTASYSGRR